MATSSALVEEGHNDKLAFTDWLVSCTNAALIDNWVSRPSCDCTFLYANDPSV